MYSVMIVDDETASIKYIRNLIAGYMPGFRVAREAFSGQEACDFLMERPVDLLITDARMPGMDGIELSRKARALLPELEIVVVSGYADFEYAKGAVSAGVNEYLLKPLNIRHTIEVLGEIEKKLDAAYARARRGTLEKLLEGAAAEGAELERLFGGARCRAGLIRFGNLPAPRGAAEYARRMPEAEDLILLRGRDDMEYLAISTFEGGISARLQALAARTLPDEAATIAYYEEERLLAQLHETSRALKRVVDEYLVIGKGQLLRMPAGSPPPAIEMPLTELRKLDFCLQSGNYELLKDILFTWAADWDGRKLTQRAVEMLLWQIAERAMNQMPKERARRQAIRSEVDELFQYARNTGELMSGFWDVLFAPLTGPRNQQQAGELAAEIRAYVRGHCPEPLTIQVVCAHFGISQTYLSRLFRRFEGATFNDYLTSCRLETAKRLIREQPGAKLRDVAHLSGYEDPSYFSKVFRLREGTTPQQYALEQEGQAD